MIELSVIIPARNEAALLGATIDAVLTSLAAAELRSGGAEVLVVDNASTDGSAAIATAAAAHGPVRLLHCAALGAARARNHGAARAAGRVLVFVDADTRPPAEALRTVLRHCGAGREAGIARLTPLDGGWRARLWWWFWGQVRRLPLSRAKAMPAFMFCTRAVFEEFGPFDERVAIAEEWPILAGLYRARRRALLYDRQLAVSSSSRRMELQRFGYLRNAAKYAWAIAHHSGRRAYSDRYRHAAETAP